jgi:SAM-dependent methyltransferase
MRLDRDMPLLPDGRVPQWAGNTWIAGGELIPYLSYTANFDGWSDDLTNLHERDGGSLHPIDVASRESALDSLSAFGFPATGTLLEIGSASGYLLEDLRRKYPTATLLGSDVIPGALMRLHQKLPGVPLLQIDITNNPLPSGAFDAIVALNVLEHIKDHQRALQEMARLLKPGGLLLVEVPAGPSLYDGYDAFLHHFRRYSRQDVEALVQSADVQIVSRSTLGFVVYPAFWLSKKLNRMRSRTAADPALVSDAIRNTAASALVKLAFSFERRARRFFHVPFGIRHVVVARKPL